VLLALSVIAEAAATRLGYLTRWSAFKKKPV
jgi:hypothetical protein